MIDIIKSLENKTTGPVSIPIKLLKLIPDLILIPLCNIINVSFNTGVFPSLLKIVKVIPIHKSKATQDMNNYRPISLLSIFDKIIVSIPIKLLKLIPDLILIPLCNIINVSFNTGVFPSLLKIVKVIPIHKSKATRHE